MHLFEGLGKNTQFVPGEGFAYLGRSYRLRLVDAEAGSSTPPLRLYQGRFQLQRGAGAEARGHFQRWYSKHAQPWLQECIAEWSGRIGVEPRRAIVSDLGYRWASCGHSGILYFHWRTIQLPPRIIEYVVAHEIVHLQEPRHDAAFWKRLGRSMTDYAQRKQWLAENGGQF